MENFIEFGLVITKILLVKKCLIFSATPIFVGIYLLFKT